MQETKTRSLRYEIQPTAQAIQNVLEEVSQGDTEAGKAEN